MTDRRRVFVPSILYQVYPEFARRTEAQVMAMTRDGRDFTLLQPGINLVARLAERAAP